MSVALSRLSRRCERGMSDTEYRFTARPLSWDEGGGYLIGVPELPGGRSDGRMSGEMFRFSVVAEFEDECIWTDLPITGAGCRSSRNGARRVPNGGVGCRSMRWPNGPRLRAGAIRSRS